MTQFWRRRALLLVLALLVPSLARAQVLTTGSLAASTDIVAINPGTSAAITVNVSGTFSGTITFQCDATGGAPLSILATKGSTGVSATTTTTTGNYNVANIGCVRILAAASAWVSGTATITMTRGYVSAKVGSPVFPGTVTATAFLGPGTIPPQGVLRIANNQPILWENSAGTGSEGFAAYTDDYLEFGVGSQYFKGFRLFTAPDVGMRIWGPNAGIGGSPLATDPAEATVGSNHILVVGGGNTNATFQDFDVSTGGGFGILNQPALRLTGNLTRLVGIRNQVWAQADGTPRTVTNVYGDYIGNPSFGANVTATNNYGLYVEAMSGGGTLNKEIYTPGGVYADTAVHAPTFDNGASGAIQIGGASGGSVTFSGVGPHSIGGATDPNIQLYLRGAFTGHGLWIAPTLTGVAGSNLDAEKIVPAFTTPASGTTPLIAVLNLQPPTVTMAGATVTDTASLYIASAPTATVTGKNHALWVAAGLSRFDGLVLITDAVSVASGFGTGASFAAGSNIASFDLNVGTTPGTSGVLTLPAAPHGWTCRVDDITTIADRTYTSAYTTTSATITTTIGWTNNDHLYGACTPF